MARFKVEDKVLVKGGNGEVKIIQRTVLTRRGTEIYLADDPKMYRISELELYKEDKMEKTFQEVIRDIKEGEVWKCEEIDRKITKDYNGEIQIRKISGKTFNNVYALIFDNNIKYSLEREEYTFQEAFAAYEKGKEIQSAVTGIKCQKRRLPYENEVKDYCYYSDNLKEFAELKEFTISEIKGLWYINELR